ncbi:GH22290 [Drosophila grimshawi]|uniref:GH22290 n=1 Tax=Drosophila grimshawi TaxID=7222 RepID=B4JZ06_DROGR|nr:GH22290 [Drosophila grimshawi]
MTYHLVGITLVLLALGQCAQAGDNIFQRTFKQLHGEPPLPANQNRADVVQTLWIEQKLDHFDESETRTWQMRYMLNDGFFKAGGPMFIFFGGEWTISPGRITGGHMYDMAKEHNGLLVYTEHRYYGESHPLPDLSNENIQYLHVTQALADLAHFITTQKTTYEGLSDSKVIIVGGSYSATMVTWFKKIYPDLVVGGWASSAPLLAKLNFLEYKEIMGQSITLMGGADCNKRIENGIAEMETMFATKRGAEVKALLKLCEHFDVYSDLDVWTLFNEISEIFAGVVQGHYDLSNENIQYLHVTQALADLAHFITTQKTTYEGLSDSKVIIVGGSYSATMVTWFKKIYPDLVVGGWASSAPLLAKLNFLEYKEIMGQSITLMGGADCNKRIENGIAEMETMFATKRGAEVKALLKLCEHFDVYSDLDVWTLFNEISEIFAGVVQGHYAGRIEGVCQKIMAESSDLIGVSKYILDEFEKSGGKCNDLSYDAITTVLLESRYSGNIMRQWIYQTCNEYGWYQTSSSSAQPFGTKFPLALFTTMCADAYGSQYTNSFIEKQVGNTNADFGGMSPNVQNVYLTHGQLDPWRAMGIQNEAQATIIPEHAHCTDFGSISDRDTAEMRASKERIAELVREWLN